MWNLISHVQDSGKTDLVTQTADRHFRKFWQNMAPLLPMGRLVCRTPSQRAATTALLPPHWQPRSPTPRVIQTMLRVPTHACVHVFFLMSWVCQMLSSPIPRLTCRHLPTHSPFPRQTSAPLSPHSSCPALHGPYRGSSQQLPEPLPYEFTRRCSRPYLAHKPLL